MKRNLILMLSGFIMPLPVFARATFQLDLGRLWLERLGEDASAYMRTTNVFSPVLAPKTSLLIKNGTVTRSTIAANLPPVTITEIPPQVHFRGEWRGNNEGESDASILGGLGVLLMEEKTLRIPVVIASGENLACYGAHMVKDGDILDVESPVPLVMAGVTVGETYIKGFIMSKKFGGGEYLEYHDTPHFHMPMDKSSGGELILGKREGNTYYLTAYKIPFGYGVYTPPNVIHADAHLIGRYLVMYTYTDNFSTVNLKTPKGELVELELSPRYQIGTGNTGLSP